MLFSRAEFPVAAAEAAEAPRHAEAREAGCCFPSTVQGGRSASGLAASPSGSPSYRFQPEFPRQKNQEAETVFLASCLCSALERELQEDVPSYPTYSFTSTN